MENPGNQKLARRLFQFGIPIVVVLVAFIVIQQRIIHSPSSGRTYYVSPRGNDSNAGNSNDRPLATIQKALSRAEPGDHIRLADGQYFQEFHSVRDGKKSAPITIEGSRQAIVFGASSSSHIIEINHNYLTLSGFHVDGQSGAGKTKSDFRDKLIYLQGTKPGQGVTGVKLTKLLVENAGGECIRMRYFAKDNEVSGSTIRNCGIYDFRLGETGKNGEGIYIGTAPEQRTDGKNPNSAPDLSSGNHIHDNLIETHGNECVDIKEAANHNLVENNTCRYQTDPKSGGFDARGDHNIFRHNTIANVTGVGIRLGGDGNSDGLANEFYENTIKNAAAGAIRIERYPQGKMCGNNLEDSNMSNGSTVELTKPCTDV